MLSAAFFRTIAVVGHDHHFLSRLDRVSTEHVELALGLYGKKYKKCCWRKQLEH